MIKVAIEKVTIIKSVLAEGQMTVIIIENDVTNVMAAKNAVSLFLEI